MATMGLKKTGMAFVGEVCDALEITNPNVYGVSIVAEQQSSSPWIESGLWAQCRREFDEDDMLGMECCAGLDLAQTRDMTALVLVFPWGEVCDALEITNPNVYGVSIVAEVSTAVVVTLSCRATVEQSARIIALVKEHASAVKCEADEPIMVARQ